MCLTIDIPKKYRKKSKRELETILKKIATKDIVVYKLLNVSFKKGKYLSPFRGTVYSENHHYYQTGQKFTTSLWESFHINRGLHAYTNRKKALRRLRMSFTSSVVIKAIIPKGSEYYINREVGEIVSDNLIITDEKFYS